MSELAEASSASITCSVTEMTFQEQLNIDRQIAMDNGVKFEVATQSAQGNNWQKQATDLEDLMDAFIATDHLKAWKVGILALRNGGGFIYWTSHNSTLLNSKVLTIEIQNGEDK